MTRPVEPEPHAINKTLRLLERSVEWTEDLVFVIDRSMIVRYVNQQCVRPFQRDPEELIGRPLSVLLPEDGFVALSGMLQASFTSGRGCRLEEKISFPGEELWLDIRLSPILDESGRLAAVLGTSRDISERKQREELITRAKQSWEHAVDTMADHIAVVDGRHRITRVNTAMAKKLGVTVREAVGLTCYETLHGEKEPLAVCPLLQATTNGREYSAEICENHLGGKRRVSVSALRDSQGGTIGCVYVGRDLSEQETAEKARENSVERMTLLLRKAEHVVTVQDRHGKYLFFSAFPHFGVGADEVIGQTPFRFFEPAAASRMVERVMTTAATGQPAVALTELSCNGETLRFLDQVHPIKRAGKKIKTVITISKRVGEQRSGAGEGHLPEDDRPGLTRRETQVLSLIASGFSSGEIAEKLFVSKKTVATHRTRIMQKLDIHKGSALVRYAIEAGLKNIQ